MDSRTVLATGSAGLLLLSVGASAEIHVYSSVPLLGTAAPASEASSGFAVFSGVYDDENNVLHYGLEWRLQSAATEVHIHGPAARGAEAGVVADLGPIAGIAGNKSGTLQLTESGETELLEGLWYLDIHGSDFPEGEVRGQLVELSPAATAAVYDTETQQLNLDSVIVPGLGVFEVAMDRVGAADPLTVSLAGIRAKNLDDNGQAVFRHDTFGNESLWTEELRMHEVVASSVSPMTALSVGLKVDAAALPEGLLDSADLNDPATTVALLELDAVVGLKGTVENGELVSLGITCALCHSDVDDSVLEGIGLRLDGYANRDLDPGAILALSPAFADAESQAVLTSWGPGRYDPRFNQDGINHPVLIPPIYGLEDVPLETYTGDGPVSYWNAYVAVTQMGGQGHFSDPRLGIRVVRSPDLVTPRLPALFDYQISLEAPQAPAGSFDAGAAARGKAVFEGAGECAGCHSGPAFTDAGLRLHPPSAVGQEALTAERSATGLYRSTPLRALWQHAPYFHDGSAATLDEVVEHYQEHLSLGLSEAQKDDLVEYLKSL